MAYINGSEDFALAIKGDKGKSAYEIACENGYIGTEVEWLASLKGDKGDDYSLTSADKAEIAAAVNGAILMQAPIFVDSVDKMTDANINYVLKETGHIFAHMYTTAEREIIARVDIIGTTENPYERGRFSSGGANAGDVQTHTITPYIDLTKSEYQGKTIQIHLEGNRYASETSETYIMTSIYAPDKSNITGRAYTMPTGGLISEFDGIAKMTLEIHSQTSATLTLPVPLVTDQNTAVGYLRFCGLGTVNDSVYITYPDTETVTGEQWVDTGFSYPITLSDDDFKKVAEQAAAIVDANLIPLIGTGEVIV